MRSLVLIAPLFFVACFIPPTKYHLEWKDAPCAAVKLPAPWTFAASGEGRVTFAARLDGAGLLLRGQHGATLSREVYRIAPGQALARSTDTDWEARPALDFVRRSLHPEIRDHEAAPPVVEHAGQALRLTGRTFWRARETTRLSAAGRYLAAFSYTNDYGWFRPHDRVHLDVFETASGRRLFSLSGEAPHLPPFSQFDEVGWLGDEYLLMPHTDSGSEMDVCRARL